MRNLSAFFLRKCVFVLLLAAPVAGFAQKALLFPAIRSGSVDSLKKALANGADVNDSLNGYSALMAATLNGSIDQMKLLIDQGANVNALTRKGISALWLAVPDYDKTKLLLDHGADIQHKVENYGILVKLAAIPGTVRLFRFLIDKGADPRHSAPDNYLLFSAASSGDTSLVGLLLRSGLKVNDTVSNGDAPIDAATSFGTFATLKMLVDSGANVNFHPMLTNQLPAFISFTPLMYAAWSNDKPSVLYLLAHGADPNIRNSQGYTALMMVVQGQNDDAEMIQALIDHGAVVSAKTPDGTDVLAYAEKKGNTRSVEILKKYAGK